MKKIWIRLGGYVTADEATMKKIMDGNEDALVKAIKENGFEVNGHSYILGGLSEDVEFELDSMELSAK